jgi:hypothetical protein
MPPIDPDNKLAALRRYSLSLPEWHVLATIGMFPIPLGALARITASHSEADPIGSVSESQSQEAVSSCIAKKWLRVVTPHTLGEIQAIIGKNPALGPVYGLPKPGEVDFTVTGARLSKRIVKEVLGPKWGAEFAYRTERDNWEDLYIRTNSGARKALNEAKNRKDVVQIEGPSRIGRWRVYWWQTYARGYHIVLTKKPSSMKTS